ncbi:DUF1993 family protein [Parvibaculum sedimenti]|uniref:DUF1993 family protein n=1 Tax=Parvibaculum sedimenti TaxID=2608632 RepID=A0A6N6VGL6_9HYPH|nr:DUF1993 domain-containing protein [Parvibaculum sedimenti]KAB7739838.1 DUF1993 family protein [Parvibaculum sedimenti]
MKLNMHQASIPLMLQMFGSISAVLDKAAAHCEERKIDPAILVGYRLAPDMIPLSGQIQIMTDQAKGCAARLAGIDIPSYADTEKTFDELKARIAKTADFVKSVTPDQIVGSEDREVVLKIGGNELKLKGSQYFFHFFLPNFYFHATTAYDILRHAGVQIGKRDFIGSI